jgi:hypothetical protein
MTEGSVPSGSAGPPSEEAARTLPPPIFAALYRYPRRIYRPETLLTFGAYIFDRRRRANMSADVFARETMRSQEWVESVERGDCCPTPLGLEALEIGFDSAESRINRAKLSEKLNQFDTEPWNHDAQLLRRKYDLGPLSSPSPASGDTDGLIPLLHEIAYQDRLLTLTPLVLFLGLVGLLGAGQPWRGNGFDFVGLDFGAISFLGLGVVAFASLILPRVSAMLGALCRVTRVGHARYSHVGDQDPRKGAGNSCRTWMVCPRRNPVCSTAPPWGSSFDMSRSRSI